jgi:hypothetical protein
VTYWVVVVPAQAYEVERLYRNETVPVPEGPAPDDQVLLVADGEPPVVFGVGRVRGNGAVVAYTRRLLDDPQPAGGLALDGPVTQIDEDAFQSVVGRLGPVPDRRAWLVSVDLPIEAESAAEAVREFWTYVSRLGPRELPAFVSPADDELAMQAYVHGEPAELDPEED